MDRATFYISKYERLINRISSQYSTNSMDYEDNQQIARIAIWQRIDKYDESEHNEFFFFYNAIKNSVRNNYNRKKKSVETVDDEVNVDRLLYSGYSTSMGDD